MLALALKQSTRNDQYDRSIRPQQLLQVIVLRNKAPGSLQCFYEVSVNVALFLTVNKYKHHAHTVV